MKRDRGRQEQIGKDQEEGTDKSNDRDLRDTGHVGTWETRKKVKTRERYQHIHTRSISTRIDNLRQRVHTLSPVTTTTSASDEHDTEKRQQRDRRRDTKSQWAPKPAIKGQRSRRRRDIFDSYAFLVHHTHASNPVDLFRLRFQILFLLV